MKNIYLLFLFIGLWVVSCKDQALKPRHFSKVVLEPILEDSTLSIRAIEILDKNSIAFAANNNTYGLYNVAQNNWLISKQAYDSLDLQFRAVANNNTDFFMLSVANPALLFKTGSSGNMEVVYKEVHERVFYDAMDFWNTQEGIAIGDATNGCLSIIITRDGGNTWTKLPCDALPEGMPNEGAFAASDTNIAIVGNHTWVATTAGRVYYSPNKGNTWEVFKTPMVKDKETEGIYSIDFYDALNGFAIGGDYTKPEENKANKIQTKDGGRTWTVVGENQDPGYRSCVQYIPGRGGNELVAIGFKGIDYSNDGGQTWSHLSDEGFYTIRFLNDSTAYAAGQGRLSKLTFKE
ncbi:oxidoreductase [Mangrovimonas yunxiaonensis]|uniref:Oxidoreductase n=1 Tax=Mangrovimonas yunxiaonensis TaxID=1197477 RepID=A0A084TNG8_9FLAO|nr:oxidoreductase [Mangrovimonas yunxiaonensis]KFB02254.1 oxidoreductase [Mangrovimonas yunxiaonensis]